MGRASSIDEGSGSNHGSSDIGVENCRPLTCFSLETTAGDEGRRTDFCVEVSEVTPGINRGFLDDFTSESACDSRNFFAGPEQKVQIIQKQ